MNTWRASAPALPGQCCGRLCDSWPTPLHASEPTATWVQTSISWQLASRHWQQWQVPGFPMASKLPGQMVPKALYIAHMQRRNASLSLGACEVCPSRSRGKGAAFHVTAVIERLTLTVAALLQLYIRASSPKAPDPSYLNSSFSSSPDPLTASNTPLCITYRLSPSSPSLHHEQHDQCASLAGNSSSHQAKQALV